MHTRCWPVIDARRYYNSTEVCRYRDRSGTLTRIKDKLRWSSIWQSYRCWSRLWQVWILCDKIFSCSSCPFLSRSSQLLGVAEKYSGLLDGMVLMSSAPDLSSSLTSFAASSISIASLNNKSRFGEHGPYLAISTSYSSSVYVLQVLWIPPILFLVISMTHNVPCFISPILTLVSKFGCRSGLKI